MKSVNFENNKSRSLSGLTEKAIGSLRSALTEIVGTIRSTGKQRHLRPVYTSRVHGT